MANFHLEVKTISRGRGQSLAGSISYITGHTLRDPHLEKTFYHRRDDVLWSQIFLPCEAPEAFKDLQYLCDRMEQAERRWDARTARVLIGSLPNELPVSEIIRISDTFIRKNFICQGLCAVAAIHEGRNKGAPENNKSPCTYHRFHTKTGAGRFQSIKMQRTGPTGIYPFLAERVGRGAKSGIHQESSADSGEPREPRDTGHPKKRTDHPSERC